MYKCVECGHIFDDGEQSVSREYHTEIDGGFYEELASCPICGGEFEETLRCEKCGGEFLKDELVGGCYCDECLKDEVTVDNFVGFAEWEDENKGDSEVHTVEHFMMVYIYGVGDDAFGGSSIEFRELMEREFYKAAERKGKDFADEIYFYLKDYDMLGDFAEWLTGEEVKK